MERQTKTKFKQKYDNKETDLEYLDFKAKSENEVIKVPKCTYANDIKAQTTFFFCQCSPEDFYPICSACAESCHKSHKPALRLTGIYTCQCGKANHIITRDNERRFNDKKVKLQNQCIFGKFMEVTPNRGYYQHFGATLCAVCVEFCYQKSFNDYDLLHCSESDLSCQCERHYEMNVINLNVDLISKPKFHFNLQNFNFNILSKITVSKHMYIDYLVNKMSTYMSNQTSEQSKNFFSNFINFKILELFSAFAVKWENKFFHVKDYLASFSTENLIKLMSFNEPVSMLTANDAGDFTSAKFYFAEMIFNYIIRTYQLKYNNLWNIRTIINMNLFQRYIYLQEIKNFFKFDYFHNDNVLSSENTFNEFATAVLDLYDTILKINENFDFTDRILSYVFPTFNRIFKYLIKYNIINDEIKARYFELVLDTITLSNDKGKSSESYSGSEFYIVKSILYSLIYRNDRVCLNYIRNEKDRNHKKFVFEANPESDNTCKIFVQVLDKFNRTDDLSRTVIFDFYVRKIFELMIGKNEFYIKSLTNLTQIPEEELFMITCSDVQLEMRGYLNQIYLKEIVIFCTKLNFANRDYFDYNLTYELYLNQVNDVFKELKNFIFTNITFLPDLSKQYQVFIGSDIIDEGTAEKINQIQTCVKYSLFFQKVEEFLHIYSDGKTFQREDSAPKVAVHVSQNEHLEVLLHFIYLLVQDNPENLCLMMNIKPKIFANTFMDVAEKLFEFLERLCEMLYSNKTEYSYDNLYFISEVIREIVGKAEFTNEVEIKTQIKHLSILQRAMKIIKHAIPSIDMNQPDFLNAIEAINDKLQLIKDNASIMEGLNGYLFNNNPSGLSSHDLTVIETFLTAYFGYCNQLIFHDFLFFGVLNDVDLLFKAETVEHLIKESFNQGNIPFKLEYEITRFILQLRISFGLKVKNIDHHFANLYMRNIPNGIKDISLTHLSKTPTFLLNDKTDVESLVEKANMILQINKGFITKFNLIVAAKHQTVLEKKIILLNYLEHIILRPSFILLNYFILHSNLLKGSDCHIFYQMSFYFLKNVSYFYQNIHQIKAKVKENSSEDYFNSYQLEERVLDYEKIVLRSEIDLNIANEIYEDSVRFTKNTLKYFQIDRIYEIFVTNLEKVLKLKDKPAPSMKHKSLSGQKSLRTTTKTKAIKTRPSYVQKLLKLIGKYKDRVVSTYDNNLSLIKILETTDSEVDIGTSLFNYLMSKFADDLTDYSITLKSTAHLYKPGEIFELKKFEKFKLQNSYVLIYLNSLFYHDSGRFQEILNENFKDNFDLFFIFMVKELIFPTTLNETRKNYEIDHLVYDHATLTSYLAKRKSLSFEMTTLAVKFLQNLCENHNQEFQNKFFNFIFTVEKGEYLYKINPTNTEIDQAKVRLSQKRLTMVSLPPSNEDVKKLTEIIKVEKNITKPILRPHISGGELIERLNPNQREFYEKRKEKEEEEGKLLNQNETSFFNFIQHIMRMLLFHLNVDNTFQSSLLVKNKEIKNYENIGDVYKRYSDLVIEMIQGTSSRNFDMFYRRLPDAFQIFNETGEILNKKTLDSFIFLKGSLEVQSLLFEPQSLFDSLSLPMKCDLFTVINNVINQELSDISLVKVLLVILPPEKVIEVVSKYVRGLIVKHIQKIDYEDKDFENNFENVELDVNTYFQLKYRFKNDMDIYEDEFFKLSAQMFLYLTILGEKYHIPEAERILQLKDKEITSQPVEEGEQVEQDLSKPKLYSRLVNYFKTNVFKKASVVNIISMNNFDQFARQQSLQKKINKPKNNTNNMIISSKFFNKTIKNCEFMIDSSNDEADELKLKLIYFIVDPRVYLISKNNQEAFFEEVDRSSSTTKLKSLIDRLNFFMWEVDYKYSHLKKSKHLKWMLEVDYKNVDFINFCISLLINFLLLIFLTEAQSDGGYVYYLTACLALGQILINVVCLIIFILSKYRFYVLLQKSEHDKQGLSVINWLKIYLLNSFLMNDEIYLMILNIIIGCLSIISSYGSFLFSLQLLTVIKFVPTIKEIVIAFKLRLSQLMSMIGFLIILIFFYSNIGFYFLYDEFQIDLNDKKENLCATLLECTITYFNHGVRSGGGIGDILEPRSFDDSTTYWVRWVTDMVFYITVILLLLNMINGVIVSTFSQIREESNEKEEDIKNKCFICNIDRVEFEKRKIAFADHQKKEHNVKTFIRFLIYLKLINEKDLDADQSFVVGCIKNRDISCFPVLRSFSVGALDVQDDDEDDNDE